MAFDREYYKTLFVNGDYKSVKEFCEKIGLRYKSAQKYSAEDKWFAAKRERNLELSKSLEQKKQEIVLASLTERTNDTLALIGLLKLGIRTWIDKNSNNPSAKDLNSIGSAIYRVNEVERGLMGAEVSTNDLNELCKTIEEAARED